MNKTLFALFAIIAVTSAAVTPTCDAASPAAGSAAANANCAACGTAGATAGFCVRCAAGYVATPVTTGDTTTGTWTCTAACSTSTGCNSACVSNAADSKCVSADNAGQLCKAGFKKTDESPASTTLFSCVAPTCTAGQGNCKACGGDTDTGYGAKYCMTCNDGFALTRSNTAGSAAWTCAACENKGCATNCASTAAAAKCYGTGNCKTGHVQGTKAVDTTAATAAGVPATTEFYECKACTGTNCGTCKIDALDKCDTCPAAHFKESDTKCTACGTNCTECTNAANCTTCNASFPGLKWNTEKKQCLSAFKTGAGLTLGSVVAVALFSLLF